MKKVASKRWSRKSKDDSVMLRLVDDYYDGRKNVWGIHARNREQNFALNLLMDPGSRFRHADGHGRHRQDPAGAGSRPVANHG